jgi:hypothetical protein
VADPVAPKPKTLRVFTIYDPRRPHARRNASISNAGEKSGLVPEAFVDEARALLEDVAMVDEAEDDQSER